MSQIPPALWRLQAKPVDAVLAELATLRKRVIEGDTGVEMPKLSLFTLGGPIRGCEFVAYDAASKIVLVSGGENEPPLTVRFVAVSGIMSLQLQLNEDNLHLLSFGALKRKMTAVPTRLALQRRSADISGRLTARMRHTFSIEIEWERFPKSDGVLFDLGEWMDTVESALLEVGRDADGIDALGASSGIRLEPGDTTTAKLERGYLVLTAPVGEDRVSYAAASETARMLEAVL